MKIKSLADLRSIKAEVQGKIKLREQGENAENIVQIRVAMATCGIAAVAKGVMNFILEEADFKGIDVVVTQTGCMGYCYAEPTVEVTLPGKEPLVFGHVKKAKVDEIINRYIRHGELLDDIIPVTYTAVKPE